MKKTDVKKVLEAETIFITNLCVNIMNPDDLSPNEYLDGITTIVNNKKYRDELIAENKANE